MQKKSLFKVNENSYVHEKKANATTSAVTGGVETKSFLAPLKYWVRLFLFMINIWAPPLDLKLESLKVWNEREYRSKYILLLILQLVNSLKYHPF